MRVDKEVLAVLSVANLSGNEVRLTGQLDRNLYMRTDKVLQAAGGTWNKKAKAHVFDSDAETRMEQIILTGDISIPKDEYNFFPTPPEVVSELMKFSRIKIGMKCLEPSAGHGAISDAMRKEGGIVDCVELNPESVKVLREMGFETLEQDFITVEPIKIYERIVMNPPFMKQADIRHVMHAHKFLGKDGLLVSVMSSGIVFRENKIAIELRDLIEDRGGLIESLPDGSFKKSGTMVNTVIVVIPA